MLMSGPFVEMTAPPEIPFRPAKCGRTRVRQRLQVESSVDLKPRSPLIPNDRMWCNGDVERWDLLWSWGNDDDVTMMRFSWALLTFHTEAMTLSIIDEFFINVGRVPLNSDWLGRRRLDVWLSEMFLIEWVRPWPCTPLAPVFSCVLIIYYFLLYCRSNETLFVYYAGRNSWSFGCLNVLVRMWLASVSWMGPPCICHRGFILSVLLRLILYRIAVLMVSFLYCRGGMILGTSLVWYFRLKNGM